MMILTLSIISSYLLQTIGTYFGNTCTTCGSAKSAYRGERYRSYNSHRTMKPILKVHPAIINGQTSNEASYPWVVVIEQIAGKDKHLCTGSVISEFYILTAAHCLINQLTELKCTQNTGYPPPECWAPSDNIRVSKSKNGKLFGIAWFTVHPQFSLPLYQHDIALISMRKPIRCGLGVTPICLPTNGYDGFHDKLLLAGWGKVTSRHDKMPFKLRRGEMKMLDSAVCKRYFGNIQESSIICATGSPTQQSICVGDSGSSVFVQFDETFYALGVTSLYGGADCIPSKPSLFTKVSAYMPWILSFVPQPPVPAVSQDSDERRLRRM